MPLLLCLRKTRWPHPPTKKVVLEVARTSIPPRALVYESSNLTFDILYDYKESANIFRAYFGAFVFIYHA